MAITFYMIQASYGDSLLLRLPDGKWWLIDGGPGTSQRAGTWKLAGHSLFRALNTLKIAHIDRVIVTHNDADHANGIAALLSTLGDKSLLSRRDKRGNHPLLQGVLDEFEGDHFVSWRNGFIRLNPSDGSKGEFPISEIWYNDISVLRPLGNRTASDGWAKILLDVLQRVYGGVKFPAINAGWTNNVVSDPGVYGDIALYGPGASQVNGIISMTDTYSYNWNATQAALEKRQGIDVTTVTPGGADVLAKNWANMEAGKETLDNSVKNLSSIMFEYGADTADSILLTGDSTGTILDSGLRRGKKFSIMKLMHHGSSRNNYIWPGSSTATLYSGCVAFFTKYWATKYCISAESFQKTPNPDSYTLQAITEAHETQGRVAPIIYLTNGCTYKQFSEMMTSIDGTPRSPRPKIYFLKRTDKVDYGQITLSSQGTTWTEIKTVNQALKYHRDYYQQAFDVFDAKPTMGTTPAGATLETKLSALPKPNKIPSSGGPVRHGRRAAILRVAGSPLGGVQTRSRTLRSGLRAPVLFTALALETSGPPTAQLSAGLPTARLSADPPPAPTKPKAANWHDLMIANLVATDLSELADIQDVDIPAAVPFAAIQADGVTPSWVDLPTLIQLMEADNLRTPTARQPLVPPEVIQAMKFWFGGVTQNPVLAILLLGNFLNQGLMDKLLVQLPVNTNGPTVDELTFSDGKTPGSVITNLTVENFRAKVVVPSPVQLTSGNALDILAFHFNLAPPPAGWTSVNGLDALQWTIPFDNGIWTNRMVTLKHTANLRVKILRPQYQNALVLCYFDSVLTVGRTTPAVNHNVQGTMVVRGGPGESAVYDIRFKGEETGPQAGTVGLMDMFALWAPLDSSFETVFAAMLDNLEMPGIDVSKLLSDPLRLKDCGIVLRQFQQEFLPLSIDDLYGTIQTSETLTLATEALGLPGFLSTAIPRTLPNLMITLSNITESIGSEISFAISQDVEGIGFVVLQISLADNFHTRFDIWGVCDSGVTIAQVLSALGFDYLTDQFHAASVFANALSHVQVPFLRVTIGKADPNSTTAQYGVEQLQLILDITDVSVPEENPVLTLENFRLEMEHQSPANSDTTGVLKAYGNATINIAGIDARVTLSVDQGPTEVKEFFSAGQAGDVVLDSAAPAPAPVTYDTQVVIELDFESEAPSLGDIVRHFVQELDNTGIIKEITDAVPSLISDVVQAILSIVEYQEISVTVSRNSSTKKWSITRLLLAIDLGGSLKEKLNALNGKLKFELPTLTLIVLNPSDKPNRTWNINIECAMNISGVLTEIRTNVFQPPPGLQYNPAEFGVDVDFDRFGHGGAKLGTVVTYFADQALEATGIDPTAVLPQGLQDVISSINISLARVSFTDVSTDPKTSSYKLKWVEAMIKAGGDPWTIVDDFQLSDILIHFSYNTGAHRPAPGVVAPPKDVSISLAGNLKLGSHELSVAVSHSTGTGAWSIAFSDPSTLSIVELVEDCISGIGQIEIPDMIKNEINKILKIDISSFFISYQPAKTLPTGTQYKSITFSQNGEISLFGIGTNSINVICEKRESTWAWTVAVALPSPCYPFRGILPSVPGLSTIQILSGYIAAAKGAPSSKVTAIPPTALAGEAPTTASLLLSGRIIIEGDSFLDLIAKIITIKEVDVLVQIGAQPQLDISIPLASGGVKILDIFTVETFNFQLRAPTTIGLGATVSISAAWLSKNVVHSSFFLLVELSGAFGAELNVSRIEQPFGLEFLALKDSRLALVWLAELVAPKSLAVKAGVEINLPGAREIEASFDVSIDPETPSANWFRMAIEHLTLKNVVNALTAGRNLPSPLDADVINIGFEQLMVNFVPFGTAFDITVDSQFYLFFFRGRVSAKASLMGFRFAANLDKIDVLGLIKLNAYKNTNVGPFVYVDTTVQSIVTGKFGPPDWLQAQTIDDPTLVGAIFALTADLRFLGITFYVYGVISINTGLTLVVGSGDTESIPGVKLSTSKELRLTIDSTHFAAGCSFMISLSLDLPNIEIFGTSLGKLSGELFELDTDININIVYVASQFQHEGLEFTAHVKVEILGLPIDATVHLDVTVSDIEQVPDAIKHFVEDEVVDALKKEVLGPLIKLGEDIEHGVEDAVDEVKNGLETAVNDIKKGFNTASSEITQALFEAGYGLDVVAHVLKQSFDMALHEVVGALNDFGNDINDIATAVGDAFAAFPNEIASALISAGVTIEHAFETAFGQGINELGNAFNIVGNSIVGFAEDAVGIIGHFIEDDVGNFLQSLGDEIVDGLDSVLDDIGGFFEDNCEVM